MTKFRKIKPKSSRRKKLILFFVAFSILFISWGYAIVYSNLGFLGTLFVGHFENKVVIQSFSSSDKTKFRSDTYREKIETITFSDNITPPSNYEESWSLGVNNKSNVMGYIVKRSDIDIYDLYIQGDGNLYANPDSSYLFYNLKGLKEIINLNILNTSDVTKMSSMFENCEALTSFDLSKFDTSKVTNMSSMFQSCIGLKNLDISKFKTVNVTDMSSMFRGCSGLTVFDFSGFDTGNVSRMDFMFCGVSSLSDLDLSSFDTSNVTNMSYMFYYCGGLKSVNLSSFNTSKVTNMSFMFNSCSGLTSLDVSKFDTNKVTTMENMFYGCSGLTSLDVSKFNTSNVTSMASMFLGCSKLSTIDLNKFNTSNVVSMYNMFYDCSGLTSLNLFDFITNNVTDMTSMFYNCSSLTSLDLSSFDTSKVTSMRNMFSSCSNIITIYVGSKWSVASVTSDTSMFWLCGKLVGQSGVTYNSLKVGSSMANYNTGYLTLKSFARDLKKLVASSTVIVDDGTTDHNMRFTGKSPNNYVTFNGEEWRVIGVFNNISNGSGTSESRVKIIRNSSIGLKPWDSNNSNTWSKASLNKELQTLYGSNEMVDNAVWYLGDSGSTVPITKESYTIERGTKVASGNGQTWTGKVGLMYPSDYGFASSACKDGSKTLRYYNDSTCVNTNWMYIGTYEWTISPQAHNTDRVRGVDVDDYGSGYISGYFANSTFYETRPTLYLKSTVRCKNCSDSSAGTKTNPFILAY